MKKSILALVLGLIIALSLVAAACTKAPAKKVDEKTVVTTTAANCCDEHEHEHEHEHDKKGAHLELSDWEGTWNNMGDYLDKPELQKGFEELAKNEKKSVEEAKSAYVAKRKCDIHCMVIKGNKVTFLDNFADKGGKEIATVEYEWVSSHKTKHGNHTLSWEAFKAKDANAQYPIMVMMPVHGEETLTHFHMRYGTDVDELLKKDGWYPTFVKPSSTDQQLIDEIAE